MRKVFISYRKRDLTTGYAGQIHGYLEDPLRLGPSSVFRDLDNLPPGVEFLPRIKKALADCDLALVLIGPYWNPLRDGRPRLRDEKDVLRMEVAEALRRAEVTVLPILFYRDELPPLEELPDDLQKLHELNYVKWHSDDTERSELDRLWRKLGAIERGELPEPTTQISAVPAPAGAQPGPATIAVGANLGGCLLEGEIASSEAATVFRGRQLTLDRSVAVKVMSGRAALDPAAKEEFLAAGKRMAGIGHDHIIPVYDIGEVADRPYLVMHLVEGGTLAHTLENAGPLGVSQALQVVAGLASGLDAAHAVGLAHRTLTPANVLIERASARLFMFDFRIVDGLGEQQREAAVRTDITALAQVLAELLGGPGQSFAEPLPAVPESLRQLVARMLSPVGTRHFHSAGALVSAAFEACEQASAETGPDRSDEGPAGAPAVSLSEQVRELTQDVVGAIARPASRFTAEGVRRRLGEPIHLALAGQGGTGKSTLVNALLRRKLAPTDGRLRNVIGWYRFGRNLQVDMLLRSGDRIPAEIDQDGIRTRGIGCPPTEIAAIDATLPLDHLRSLTLIDLPDAELHQGGDLDEVGGCSTEDYARAIQRADAVMLTIKGNPKLAADAAAGRVADLLDALSERAPLSAVNAVALVSAAGLSPKAGDPLGQAHLAGAEVARDLGRRVAAVLPVVPLLAQTVTSSTISDQAIYALSELAELSGDEHARVLEALDSGGSLAQVAPLSLEEIDCLDSTLGAHGIKHALELAEAGVLTRASLTERMRELSGLDPLRREISGLQLRADAIKASQALMTLEKLSYDRELGFIGDRVEELRLSGPGMELTALTEAFSRCVSGRLRLREDKLTELQRLLTGRTAAERLGLGFDASDEDLEAEALTRLAAWQAFASSPVSSADEKRVAAAVVRHFQALADEAASATRRGTREWARS